MDRRSIEYAQSRLFVSRIGSDARYTLLRSIRVRGGEDYLYFRFMGHLLEVVVCCCVWGLRHLVVSLREGS